MLKTSLAIAACILIAAPIANAQGGRPEFFVGYTNLQSEGLPNRNDPNWPFNTNFFRDRTTLHGVNLAVSGYGGSGIGLTGDFSFSRKGRTDSFTDGEDSQHTDTYYFLGGPSWHLAPSSSRVEPFLRAMAGAAHTRFNASSTRSVTSGGTSTSSFGVNSTDFAASVGGGLDIRVGDVTKIRVIQLDYAPVFLRDRTVNTLGAAGVITPATLDGQRQDNFRFSFGVAF